MKHSYSLLAILSLLFAGLLAACSGAPAPKLDGGDWQLVEMNGKKLPLHIQITLGFKDGQVNGKAPCNGYGAGYTQEGSKLTFEPFFSTLMYCDGVMDYETEFLTAFATVKSFQLENDRLSLLDESGAVVLVFGKLQPYPALDGSSWKVSMVGEIMVPEDVEVTLNFAEGKINGKAACNQYFADYTQKDAQLSFTAPGATKMFCDQAGVMELESAFLSSLEKVQKFEIQMGGLTLLDASGTALMYLKP